VRSQFNPFVYITLFFLAQAFIFNEAWSSLIALWLKMDYAYSMGLLALALAVYSIYLKRNAIAASAQKPHIISYIFLFGSALALTLSSYLNIQIGSQLMLVPILFFGICSIAGLKAASITAIPLLYILFAIPVWDYLNPLLQALTTLVSTFVVELLKMPALIQGNTISLPYGALEIAGGCSGLRYFIVTLILVLYFSQQRPNSTRVVITMFCVAAGFSLIANWVRVVLLIVIAHQTNMESSLVADHEMFGWVIYIFTMLPCLLLLLKIEKRGLAQKNNVTAKKKEQTSINRGSSPRYLLLSILAISAAPILMGVAQHKQAKSYAETNFETVLAPTSDGWTIKTTQEPPFETGFSGMDKESNFQLINTFTGAILSVKVLQYGPEKQGAELVNNNNQLASEDWLTDSTKRKDFYNQSILTNKLNQKFAVSWYYRIAETRTTHELKAKLSQLASVFENAPVKALVATSIQCPTNCANEFAEMDALLAVYQPY